MTRPSCWKLILGDFSLDTCLVFIKKRDLKFVAEAKKTELHLLECFTEGTLSFMYSYHLEVEA